MKIPQKKTRLVHLVAEGHVPPSQGGEKVKWQSVLTAHKAAGCQPCEVYGKAYLKAKRAKQSRQLTECEEIVEEGRAELKCGCVVEPDGQCGHGNKSLLLELGLI